MGGLFLHQPVHGVLPGESPVGLVSAASSQSDRARRPAAVRGDQPRCAFRRDRPPLRRLLQPLLEAAARRTAGGLAAGHHQPDRAAKPGINDLRPAEYVEGWKILSKKIRRYRPDVVALVGVTLYRAILPLLPDVPAGERRAARLSPGHVLGLRPETIHGARLFVLPNPSGRNANFSYDEMLAAFRSLKRYLSA
jgi:uracil-DNA glycosylase